jgi:Uma2 family endonuclease
VHRILGNKLSGKSCVPFIAPTDVVLSDKDVVQPDVVVVCDKAKITDANIQGAPELVVEVLSPSTALKDRREKKALYEKQGVREYVIIDPIASYVERFVLKDGAYSLPDILGPDETLVLQSLEDMEVPLSEVFEIEELKNNKA